MNKVKPVAIVVWYNNGEMCDRFLYTTTEIDDVECDIEITNNPYTIIELD